MWSLLATSLLAVVFISLIWARLPHRALVLPLLLVTFGVMSWLTGPVSGAIWTFGVGALALLPLIPRNT